LLNPHLCGFLSEYVQTKYASIDLNHKLGLINIVDYMIDEWQGNRELLSLVEADFCARYNEFSLDQLCTLAMLLAKNQAFVDHE